MSAAADGRSGNGGGEQRSAQSIRLTIPAKPEYITLGRLALTGIARLRTEPMGEEVLGDLKFALTEACTNSVRHAYAGGEGTVEITYELYDDRLVVEVADEGEGFEPPPGRARGSTTRSSRRRARDRDHRGARRRVRDHRARCRRLVASLRQAPGVAAPVLPLVNVGHKSLGDYRTLVTRGLMEEIKRLGEPLAGARVVHISATAFGGGVAEINYTLVPLMADAGLDVEWRIMQGPRSSTTSTKAMHNALQGDPRSLTDDEAAIFARYNAENAAAFPEADYDYVIVHDPQPAAMIEAFPSRRAKWIWRGHIDFSTPNQDVFDVLLPSLRRYDASIFHMREYAPKARRARARSSIWPPAIDPLAAEEHGALARGRRLHRRPVRDRRRAAAPDTGLALRSLEGPARRDRRLPPRQAPIPRGAARADRLDGARRPGGVGVLQPHRRARRR